MLWASPPAAGADADGRFDVDSVLVTEFLLSFVGTLAGLKLSSDIAACIHTAQAFGAFSAKAGSKRICIGFGRRRSACWQRFGCRTVSTRSRAHSVAHASSQSVGSWWV